MLTWLADELREAGCRVVEVPGWKARGSSTFAPVGVTWHATAGSRNGTAQGEVNTILNGSATAPPPIAQLMLWRDGTFYVCAAGRCNHNKVGWDGPNKGLGNTQLLGIEMANDNAGESWPAAQLDAARRGTAAIMRRLGADPMRRLAAHYEHQPYATRPPGERSTKSDPFGVRMSDERPRVAALMTEDDVTKTEFMAWMTEWANSDGGQRAIGEAVREMPLRIVGSGDPANPNDDAVRQLGTILSHVDNNFTGINALVRAVAADEVKRDAALTATIAALPGAVAEELADEGGADGPAVQAAVERALSRLQLTVAPE